MRIALFLLLLVGLASRATPAPAAEVAPTNRIERYVYETIESGDAASNRVEQVTMEFAFEGDYLETRYRSRQKDGSADIRIQSGKDGSAMSATKADVDHDGRKVGDGRIWVEGDKVCVEQTPAGGKPRSRKRERGDLPLATDASLLGFLRQFPFGGSRTVSVLIATFDRHFVVMKLREAGAEAIETPAGRFECYKLEGAVDLRVAKIRTTFWVTREPPHFLVRYEGRRGLFWTPTYVTSLVALER